MIQMISENEFKLTKGGHEMTLIKDGAEWAMYTVNAAVKAWNNGYAAPKYFQSLKAVEGKYKSWVGISDLAAQ
ncbi:MAG TPA: hypothetical protein PKD17_12690 [Cellvibrionaceae bacterium]|nr:hypothetical protein [Cellvibrionaceae bacterium]